MPADVLSPQVELRFVKNPLSRSVFTVMSLTKSDSLRGVKLEWSVQLWSELDASVLKRYQAGELPPGTQYDILVEATLFGQRARVMAVRYGTNRSSMVSTQERSFRWGTGMTHAREPESNAIWQEAPGIVPAAPAVAAPAVPTTNQAAARTRSSRSPQGPQQPPPPTRKGKKPMRDPDRAR